MIDQTQLDLILEFKNKASKELDAVQKKLTKLESQSKKFSASFKKSWDSAVSASKTFSVALGGLATAALFSGNKVQELQNKIIGVSDSQEQANDTFNKLADIAQRSRSSLDGTVGAFQRFQIVNQDLGIPLENTFNMIESINKGLVAGGATTSEASAATLQLAQAYASGRLQGDEFRSLSETFPLFMKAMSESMDMPIGKLKEMASDGKITRDEIVKAVETMGVSVNETFSKMPITISQSMTNLETTVLKGFQRIEKESKLFQKVSDAINEFAKFLEEEVIPKVIDFTNFIADNEWAMWALTGAVLALLTPLILASAKVALVITALGFLGGAIGATVKAIKDLTEWIGDHIDELEDMASQYDNTMQSMLDSVKEKFPEIGGVLQWFYDDFKDKVTGIWETIKNVMSGNFAQLIEDMKQAAKDMIEGFVQGMMDHVTYVQDKAKEVFTGIGDAVKGALRIQSPSKLFQEFGEYSMEGFAVGLGEGKEKVTEALNKLISTFDDSISGIEGILGNLKESHNSTMQSLRDDMKSTEDSIKNLKDSFAKFQTGQADSFGDAVLKQEAKIRDLIANMANEKDSGKIEQLKKQIEEEKRILEQARQYVTGSKEQEIEKRKAMEQDYVVLMNQIQMESDIQRRASLQARADELSIKIEYMKEREKNFSESQKTLALGVEKARLAAGRSDLENFLFNMQNKAVEEKKLFDLRMAQEQERLADVKEKLVMELDAYNIRTKEILKVIIAIKEQQKNALEEQTRITEDEIKKQIAWYKKLEDAAKFAAKASLSGGLRSNVAGYANGGMVQHFANGGFAKGTDTVPAMLTPGEIVLNAAQQKNVADQMQKSVNITNIINIETNVGEEQFAREIWDKLSTEISYNFVI